MAEEEKQGRVDDDERLHLFRALLQCPLRRRGRCTIFNVGFCPPRTFDGAPLDCPETSGSEGE